MVVLEVAIIEDPEVEGERWPCLRAIVSVFDD